MYFNSDNSLPLSPYQELFFYEWELVAEGYYNVFFIQELQGQIDRDRLNIAWEKMMMDILPFRSSVSKEYPELSVNILDKFNSVVYIDHPLVLEEIKLLIKQPFNLVGQKNLLRLYVIKTDVDSYRILFVFHHFIGGGMTTNAIVDLLSHYYNNPHFQYPVSLEVQQQENLIFLRKTKSLLDTHRDKLVDFWRRNIGGGEGISLDFLKGTSTSSQGETKDKIFRYYSVPIKYVGSIKHLVRQYHTTEYVFHLTLFAILFHKHVYEPPEKLLLSIPYLINNKLYIQGVNAVLIPFTIKSTKTFLNILEDTHLFFKAISQSLIAGEDVLPAYTPTYLIMETAGIHKESSLVSVSKQASFLKRVYCLNGMKLKEEVCHSSESSTFLGRFHIRVQRVTDEQMIFFIDTEDIDINVELVDAFFQRYFKLLEDVLSDVSKTIGEYNMITDKEYQYLVYDYNKTERDYPKDKTIHQLFEEQVARTSNNIAVVFEEKQLTYQELNNKANQLAYYLYNNYNTKADDIICLLLERSEWMIIAILGVLKSGAAYCPISPEYPEERVLFILQDTQPKCLITNCKLKIENIELPIVNVTDEQFLKELYSLTINHLPLTINSHFLAYIIYTSGTTGNPKGVMIEHSSVINLQMAQSRIWLDSIKENKTFRLLLYANYSFDAFVFELFASICNGHTSYLISSDIQQDFYLLANYIQTNNIEIATLPPAILQKDVFLSLDKMILAGESPNIDIIKRYYEQEIEVFNAYGPTEITVCATMHHYSMGDSNNNIGKPIDNKSIYVLNNSLHLLPIGSIGELYIGGDGLARGYLNRPELTAERFVVNPFQIEEEKKQHRNGRLYKTGDVVRMLPDGNIEYIGRNDFQVKIRGYRIELGEIEIRIQGFQTRIEGLKDEQVIEQAVVLINEKGDNRYLVGYFVAKEQVDIEELRSYLSKQLPEYMVPTGLVQIEQMPLTVNGKLDRNVLLNIEYKITDKVIELPKNNTEERLLKIWSNLLQIAESELSVMQSFFRLGGNSILSIRLMNLINKGFNTSFSVRIIFERNTIRQLAEYLLSDNTERIAITKQVFNSEEEQILSYAQNRLWFIYQYDKKNSAVYNIPMVFEMDKALDKEKLKDALLFVVEKHEILRTIIEENEKGISYQSIKVISENLIQEEIYSSKSDVEEKILNAISYSFQLDKELPIQIKFFMPKKKDDTIVLTIVVHHIAFDGWSVGVFQKEVYHAYQLLVNQKPLTHVINIQYKDYALWQRNFLQGIRYKKELNYWKGQLDGYNNSHLATDFSRPLEINYEGDAIVALLSKETSQNLKAVAKELNASLYSVLLSGYYLFLSAYSNEQDIVVGSPFANRHYAGTEEMIGFFVNSLALRVQIDFKDTLKAYIKKVNAIVTQGQNNQDIPFEQLVDELHVERDTSRHPIFQIMFGVQDFGGDDTILFKSYQSNRTNIIPAKFDITTMVSEVEDGLQIYFNYAIAFYKRETIEQFVKTYECILTQIVRDRLDNDLKSIRFVNNEEYNYLIYDYNKTEREYPKDKTIHQLFEEQVVRTPNNIAVIFEEKQLTYQELNNKANQLAHYLHNNYNTKADDIICLLLERNEWIIIAILGVLKSGAAYCPISPEYPEERLLFILRDTQPKCLITNCKLKIENVQFLIVNLMDEEFLKVLASLTINHLPLIISSHALAYIIYTSGTTGNPKGVMVEHKSIINLVFAQSKEWGIHTATNMIFIKTLFFINIVFDPHVSEIFSTLLFGHCGYLVNEGKQKNISELNDYVIDQSIVLATLPSALLNTDVVLPLLKLIIGGEVPMQAKIEAYQKKGTKIFNSYGVTEATVCTTMNVYIKKSSTKDIGKPIANQYIYILSHNKKLLPIGSMGELHIGGDGLARGYLNRPELTAERFIKNPFQTEEEKKQNKNERIYKTGDLVRMLSDGNIEYIGRNDFQVKIRGYRIELGEIENRIQGFQIRIQGFQDFRMIEQAVVLVNEKGDNKYLVGYFVAKEQVDIEELRSHLSKQLPDYMVPTGLVQIEQMPLTVNGKLDRRYLLDIKYHTAKELIVPHTTIEKELRAIWAKILGIEEEDISISDSFFRLGGNSILMIRVLTNIKRQYPDVVVNMPDLFTYPTIVALSSFIEGEIKKKVERDTIQVYCRKQIEQEDIAVIAMSGEFSQVEDLEKLWEVLEKKQETAKRYTMEECESLGIPKSVYAHSDFVPISNAMGFSSAYWDALFFKQTPQTARWLHPNIRKLVEHAWLCLDSTGYTVGREKRNIGVYAGVSNDMNYMVDFLSREDTSTFWEFSSLHASAATQVSYMLNLRGVALTVQTACSTGLAVVDTACIALQHGCCDMAIAGASRIDVQKRVGYMYSEGSIYSKDGYCKTFDEGSSGTIGGNGVGVVLLKRLSDAKRDGDKVLAIIKSSASNNDGSNKVSYTAPSVQGQLVCIAEAHLYSKTTLEDLDYIECHGTATALGDPIEVEGLYQAIEGVREIRKENHGVKKILLGSVKANIGHTDTTAGMAGLIKVLLMLQKEMIPGQPNFEKINPHIAIEKTCFEVSKHNRPWIRKEKGLRTAGVSSFGIGGTNVHLVVQEFEQAKEEECIEKRDMDSRIPYLFVMSAMSIRSLDLYQESLLKYIGEKGNKRLSDISYSLLDRKEGLGYRRWIVARNNEELQQQLSLPLPTSKIQEKEVVPNFVFLFDGQGSWYPNAGYEWYRDNAVFRQAVDRCLEITQLYYDFDYREVLYPSYYYSSSKKREVKGMDYIHASIFILGYGMASVLKSDGIEANAIMGHSLGELIGAVWSGLWTLEDGLGLIIERSRLMEAMPDGILLSVQGSKDVYVGYDKREKLELVLENSPASFVVLGDRIILEDFREYCKNKGVESRCIEVLGLVHSEKMRKTGQLFSEAIEKRKVRKLDIRLMSCINGDWLSEKRAKSGVYWGDQMCSKVEFSKGIDRVLLEMPEAVFIEIGAGSGLCSFIQDTNAKAKVLSLLPSRLQREQGKEDVAKVFNRLEVWGMLWSLGVKVSWSELHLERVGEPKWVDVPVYCFDKQLYVMYEQEIVGLHADSSTDMLVKSREQGVLEEQRGCPSLEEEVKQVYQLVLGYEEISEVDSFSKMGGTSLRLIQLLTKIKNLGYEITMGELLRYDSIDKLSKYLEQEKERKIGDRDSSKDDNKHTVGSLYRDNILVLLREGSDKSKNIFFFHAVGGTVGGYMNIAQGISEEYNCYGIQNINVYGDQLIEVNKMEELVMIYVAEVLKVNPLAEKYYLAGSSMGGVLAYGVGSMLERMGKLVIVVTFDGWAYYTEAYHNRQRFDEVISMQIKKYKKGLQELNNKEQIDHFLSCAWKLMTCLLGYQIPKTEQLDMIICKASIVEEDRGSEANRDKLCGWRDFCGGNIDNFEIEGATHYNILEVGQNKIIEILNAKIKE